MISEGEPYRIDGSQCLECGCCAEVCPDEAIDPAPEL
ncbi:4Fe-4S binding protein [Thermodesulfobacteriota bacterium]